MAFSARIQLSIDELNTLIKALTNEQAWLTKEDLRLVTKLKKALVAAGGEIETKQYDPIEDINFKLVNGMEISQEEKTTYLNITGIAL
jgi:hypothetical protein